ncbi:MAG: DUF3789 domain-containing protein [Agathobacter sp.]|nr:DUF3789 domain-containing protein [Agathobacter sp.]
MFAFLGGTLLGSVIGVWVMCLFQINKEEKKAEEKLCSMK